MSADLCLLERVSVTEEDLACFVFNGSLGQNLRRVNYPHCLWITHRCFTGVQRKFISDGGC